MSVSRWAGLLGAVLGPLFVLAAAWVVLTPTPTLGTKARAFDAAVAAHPSDVVLLGASYAASDFDARAFGERLDPQGRPALVLSVGASSAPVWYAILKERVYGNGLRPTRVVVPVSLGTLMVTRLPGGQLAKLTDQMPEPDAVVQARQGLGRLAAWDRALAARARVRDRVLDPVRDLVPRLFLGVNGAGVDQAATLVLGDQHASPATRALPTVEEEAAEASRGELAQDPDASYLADIVALARANGAQVTLVLPPALSDNAFGQRLDPALERRIQQWAVDHRVGWLDTRGLGWDRSHFHDLRHLRPAAARTYTELVADAILAADPETGQPPPVGRSRLDARAAYQGTPPPLVPAEVKAGATPCEQTLELPDYPFLSRRELQAALPLVASPVVAYEGDRPLGWPFKKTPCSGTYAHRGGVVVNRSAPDAAPVRLGWNTEPPVASRAGSAWWVYPGTTLEWTVATAWQGPGEARLSATLLGPGTGTVLLAVGEARTPVVSGETATLAFGDRPAGWTLSISSPTDGPFVVVGALGVEGDAGLADLVAPPAVRVLDALWPDALVSTGAPAAPPPTAAVAQKAGGWAFPVGWKPVSDCSPYRVRAGEVELPVRRGRTGDGTRHVGRAVGFDLLPGVDPSAHALVYSATRTCPKPCHRCALPVWLLPGEHLVSTVPEDRRAGFVTPLLRLLLEAAVGEGADGDGDVHVRVLAGERVFLDAAVPRADLDEPVRLALVAPLPPTQPGPLTVRVHADPTLPPLLIAATFEDQ